MAPIATAAMKRVCTVMNNDPPTGCGADLERSPLVDDGSGRSAYPVVVEAVKIRPQSLLVLPALDRNRQDQRSHPLTRVIRAGKKLGREVRMTEHTGGVELV